MDLHATKKFFFDRQRVLAAADRAQIRVLGKFGAYVRTRSRSSLRRRKAVSSPGSPPSVHSRDDFASLKNILFAYEPTTKTTIVGMVRTNSPMTSAGPVTKLQEQGGSILKVSRHTGRVRRQIYAARPTMQPAMVAEAPKFAGLFTGEVRE